MCSATSTFGLESTRLPPVVVGNWSLHSANRQNGKPTQVMNVTIVNANITKVRVSCFADCRDVLCIHHAPAIPYRAIQFIAGLCHSSLLLGLSAYYGA